MTEGAKVLAVVDDKRAIAGFLRAAVDLARSRNARLHVVHICPLPDFLNRSSVLVYSGSSRRTVAELALPWLEGTRIALRQLAPDMVTSVDIEYGDPFDRVVDLVEAGGFTDVMVETSQRAAALGISLGCSFHVASPVDPTVGDAGARALDATSIKR